MVADMKIVVCVKFFEGELGPMDAAALECALTVQSSSVTVVSMGPMSFYDRMKTLTRYNIADAVLLSDPAFAGADTLATSYVLSHYIKTLSPDLILCGRQSVDGDTAQVGPCTATMLGYNLITNVMEFGTDFCKTRLCDREKVVLPALLTVERIANLRFPSIFSKERDVRVLSADDIGADRSRCGTAGSPTVVISVSENKAGRRRVKFIAPGELLPLISSFCCSDSSASSSVADESSPEKLPVIHIVGHRLFDTASRLAEKVEETEETDPLKIAAFAKNADVLLFPADLTGRRTAPVVSATLNTGLCADCTRLTVENGELIMHRPARGGNVIAKIRCTGKPVCATVRLSEPSSAVIVSAGRGCAEQIDAIRKFTERHGFELCASRAAVDMGVLPYEKQVGLTGRSVSPRVYLAVGISGAVHHTCAIEGAGCIIAVNPDKNARIFDYSDYGIIAKAEEILDL